MRGVEAGVNVGQVQVLVGEGLGTDALVQRCVDRICFISADASPEARVQAEYARAKIAAAVRRTVEETQRSTRTNIIADLASIGMFEAANFLRGN